MSTLTSNATKRQQFRQLSVLIGLNFVDMLGFAMVFPLLSRSSPKGPFSSR